LNGLERKDELEEIFGATDFIKEDNSAYFLVKWKSSSKKELIKATELRKAFPQEVINFYEKHLTWRRASTATTDEKEEQHKE